MTLARSASTSQAASTSASTSQNGDVDAGTPTLSVTYPSASTRPRKSLLKVIEINNTACGGRVVCVFNFYRKFAKFGGRRGRVDAARDGLRYQALSAIVASTSASTETRFRGRGRTR